MESLPWQRLVRWQLLAGTDMAPDVQRFVIAQLLVIIVPVGALFFVWIRMLGRSRPRS